MTQKSKISIVVSLYNEADGVQLFAEDLINHLGQLSNLLFEVLWVNDGSLDATQSKVEEIVSSKVTNVNHKTIEFSKNFGHEAAMIAGIDHATGDAIICMDGDGQHPPSVLIDMIKAYQNNHDIVLMERTSRADASFVKKWFSKSFYKFMNAMSSLRMKENSSDFFLISNQVADVLKNNFRERNRFIRGFIQSLGFNQFVLKFEAPKRLKGESNYSFTSLLKLGLNAVFSFSNKPLRIGMIISLIFVLFTIVVGTYSIVMYFLENKPPEGYTTIILFLSISFSILFLVITIMAMYFEKALNEIRQRPIYIVKKVTEISDETANDI